MGKTATGGVDGAGTFRRITRLDDLRLAEIFAKEVLLFCWFLTSTRSRRYHYFVMGGITSGNACLVGGRQESVADALAQLLSRPEKRLEMTRVNNPMEMKSRTADCRNSGSVFKT